MMDRQLTGLIGAAGMAAALLYRVMSLSMVCVRDNRTHVLLLVCTCTFLKQHPRCDTH